MRHSFDTVITITAGSEDEHFAKVTGWYTPARTAPLNGAPDDEEPSPAAFDIDSVTITVGGKALDFMPFLTVTQCEEIAQEAVNDVSCLPRRAMAELSRAMGGSDDLFMTLADICRPVRP